MIVLSVMVRNTYTGNIIQSAESSYGHHFAYYHAGTLVFMPPKSQLTKMYREGALGCFSLSIHMVFFRLMFPLPGSGKTLAYLVPLLQLLAHRPPQRPPRPGAVVLAPTRELASQIATEAMALCREGEMKVACIFGGVPYRSSLMN